MLRIFVITLIAMLAFIILDLALYFIYKLFVRLLEAATEIIDNTLIGKEE